MITRRDVIFDETNFHLLPDTKIVNEELLLIPAEPAKIPDVEEEIDPRLENNDTVQVHQSERVSRLPDRYGFADTAITAEHFVYHACVSSA